MTAFGRPRSAPRPSHMNASGNWATDSPAVRRNATPRAISITASVTMNEGIRNIVTIRPENRPETAQTAIPANEASTIVSVLASRPPNRSTSNAAHTDDSAIKLPTERSMPPVIMTIVMPMAMIALTAVWLATLIRFAAVRKFGQ